MQEVLPDLNPVFLEWEFSDDVHDIACLYASHSNETLHIATHKLSSISITPLILSLTTFFCSSVSGS